MMTPALFQKRRPRSPVNPLPTPRRRLKPQLGISPRSAPLLRACCSFLIGLSALSATLPAAAQSPAELESARKHFRAARDFEEAKQWEDARRELNSAVAIKETPGLRYHLAYCEEQLANYAESLSGYERAQELLDAGQKAADVAKLIGPAIERVGALVGRVTLKLPSQPLQELLLDGNKLDDPGSEPLRLNPGAHRLEAKAAGHQPFVKEFVVRAGQAQDIQISLDAVREAAPAAATQDTPPADVSRDSGSLKPYVLIAEGVVTAVGIGLGVGFALQASKAGEEADEASAEANRRDPQRACSNPDPAIQDVCGQFVDFKQQQTDARTLSTIGFVTAGVGAASLIATWLFWPTEDATAPPENRAGLRGFQATPAPGGAWVALHGAF